MKNHVPTTSSSVTVSANSLSFMQWIYMWKYESYRNKGLDLFKLPENATLEDFRPHVAKLLGLPEITSFTGILSHEKVRTLLSEERRRHIVSVFNLHPDSTWFDIQRQADEIRIQRNTTK